MFNLHILKSIFNNLKDREEIFCESTNESRRGGGFQMVLGRDKVGNNEYHGTLYVKMSERFSDDKWSSVG